MPPPLSGNKATKISALKIPSIFAQKQSVAPAAVVTRSASRKTAPSSAPMGNKFGAAKDQENGGAASVNGGDEASVVQAVAVKSAPVASHVKNGDVKEGVLGKETGDGGGLPTAKNAGVVVTTENSAKCTGDMKATDATIIANILGVSTPEKMPNGLLVKRGSVTSIKSTASATSAADQKAVGRQETAVSKEGASSDEKNTKIEQKIDLIECKTKDKIGSADHKVVVTSTNLQSIDTTKNLTVENKTKQMNAAEISDASVLVKKIVAENKSANNKKDEISAPDKILNTTTISSIEKKTKLKEIQPKITTENAKIAQKTMDENKSVINSTADGNITNKMGSTVTNEFNSTSSSRSENKTIKTENCNTSTNTVVADKKTVFTKTKVVENAEVLKDSTLNSSVHNKTESKEADTIFRTDTHVIAKSDAAKNKSSNNEQKKPLINSSVLKSTNLAATDSFAKKVVTSRTKTEVADISRNVVAIPRKTPEINNNEINANSSLEPAENTGSGAVPNKKQVNANNELLEKTSRVSPILNKKSNVTCDVVPPVDGLVNKNIADAEPAKKIVNGWAKRSSLKSTNGKSGLEILAGQPDDSKIINSSPLKKIVKKPLISVSRTDAPQQTGAVVKTPSEKMSPSEKNAKPSSRPSNLSSQNVPTSDVPPNQTAGLVATTTCPGIEPANSITHTDFPLKTAVVGLTSNNSAAKEPVVVGTANVARKLDQPPTNGVTPPSMSPSAGDDAPPGGDFHAKPGISAKFSSETGVKIKDTLPSITDGAKPAPKYINTVANVESPVAAENIAEKPKVPANGVSLAKKRGNKVVTVIKKETVTRRNGAASSSLPDTESQKEGGLAPPPAVRQTSIDSNYGSSSTLHHSQSNSSISSNDTVTSSNYESLASASSVGNSFYDTAMSQPISHHLPPVAPHRKPYHRSATAPVAEIAENARKIAAHLQTRPLRHSPHGAASPRFHSPSPAASAKPPGSVTTGRLVISRSPSPATTPSRRSSLSRSESPSLRSRSTTSYTHSRASRSPTPRRIFPQEPSRADLDELMTKDQAPVVFDANLSFVIGCKSQIRQNVKSTAAHMDATTASNYLSTKISDFLKRTDHVMDEWKYMGHRGDDENEFVKSSEERRILGKSKSAVNIAIKGYTLFSKDRSHSHGSRRNSLARSGSNSTVRDVNTEDWFSESDEEDLSNLSEMTADLAEEHSTATLAAERLDAETSERIRLERELSETQNKNKSLQQSSERLEMELLYARSDLNGAISEEEDDADGDGGVYKPKYERAIRELEFTRRRLQQQHEDDLEQLVGLKKQLEKKLSDAYEEVEEQRQVVGQWKRKVQKLTSESNDLRLLLEEQNARNNLLEKKQRKFDSETQLLHDEVRQEKQQRDRLSREKDLILAEKYTLDNNLADVRLELELKEERLNSLQQEYNDLTFGGKSEDEVATLRKQKQDCERRLHEQEEELDDLAGQVQMLEQAKVRLEMSLEQQRKESRREAQQRDDDLEEVRGNAQKKVKALESQLENEHEERTLLLREKHSLERRLAAIAEAGRTEREGDEAQLQRLKRDLRRTKALLRDAQTMLERSKADSPGKAVIRQLRNQLDDLECARAAAVKAKQSIEAELAEVQSQLDEAHRQKSDAEERSNQANRERTDLRTQLEENEEELAEVLKKYRSTVQQLSKDQMALQEQVSLVSDLEAERNSLKDQLVELTSKLESMETLGDPTSSVQAKRMELRAKELESKLEFEQTTRARLEVQVARLKEALDKLQTELALARTCEQQAQDNIRKTQRSLRELKEEHSATNTRETEAVQKRKELEKKVESSEAETAAARADLRLALQRIADLQAAIQGELEDTTSDHSDSDHDSYSSDESLNTFLKNQNHSPMKSDRSDRSDRSSLHLDTSPRLTEKSLRVSTTNDSFA